MSARKMRVVAVVAALSIFAAVPTAAQAQKKIITVSGSTSVFPLTTKLARAWIKTKQGKKFGFKVLQGGSNVGVSDVSKGRVSIGASSRDPAASDPGGLVFTRIARDALCVVTHTGNRIPTISQSTVNNIFKSSPTITNWSTVPGSPISGTITTVGRATTSGTHDAFRNIFLGGVNQGNQVAGRASNGLVQQGVASDPQAIGYVSLAFTNGVNHGAVRRSCVRPAQREVAAVRRRSQLLLRDARRSGRRRQEVPRLDHQEQAGEHDRRDRVGSAPLTPRRRFGLPKAGPRNRVDRRAELLLGALASAVLLLIAGMIIFVFEEAWPSFAENELDWFSPFAGGSVDDQLDAIFRSPSEPSEYEYTIHAWPLIWATIIVTGVAVVIATVFSLLSAMFIVEFAPERPAPAPRAGRPAARGGAVGHLRPDRDPRDRPVHRQPHHQRELEGLGRRASSTSAAHRSASGS